MNRGIKLFTYQNIPVYLHWSFVLIVFYIGYIVYRSHLDIKGTIWLSALFIVFFLSVILHEFGHALMARRYGISTKDILLTPIGGVARLLRIPKSPKQEFAVAIAGPLVNIAIALLLAIPILSFLSEQFFRLEPWDINRLTGKEFVYLLCIGNFFLAIFNLIPAFPMDGGRILRSLLALRLDRLVATKWAAYIGRFLALVFIAYGLFFSNYILAFIGVFVFMSAGMEYRQLRYQAFLAQKTVREVYNENSRPVFAQQFLANTEITEEPQLVIDHVGQPIGFFFKKLLNNSAANENLTVGEIADKKIIPIQLEDNLQKAIYLIQQNGIKAMPVYHNEQIVGILRASDIWKSIREKPV